MTRKPHKKSRNGCVECKRRHIKVSGSVPQNDSASVLTQQPSSTCEYAAIRRRKLSQAQLRRDAARKSAAPSDLPIKRSSSHAEVPEAAAAAATTPLTTVSPGHSISSQLVADPEASAAVNIHHMRLILHFSISNVAPEMPDHVGKDGTALVLRLALETPYLLYQVLAISARHLAYLHPADFQYYYSQAIALQTSAIERFSASQPVRSDAAMPAVLFSALLSRHSLVDTLYAVQTDFVAFIDAFVQCAQLQRGTRAVVARVSWSALLASELAPFLHWGRNTAASERVAKRGRECDQLLRLVAITPGLDPVAREACRSAVHHLQAGLDDLADPTPDKNSYQMITGWPVFLLEEFLDLLSRHRPEAAAIMGWYAVLLHRGRHMWQIGDAGAFILSSLVDYLGAEWSHWLEWPRFIIES
uniref:Zn2Cys6 transcription regulator n=1 Tax=Cordyceps militaris TaxID=73501 RepID=J3S8A5_CORMI|nr:Zn2Cys6 transcription regulator [Cordyceps militaris]